jgi:hypothetical protein
VISTLPPSVCPSHPDETRADASRRVLTSLAEGGRPVHAIVAGTSRETRASFLSLCAERSSTPWADRVVMVDARSLLYVLRFGLTSRLTESDWRAVWLSALARTIGLTSEHDLTRSPVAHGVVFVVGDLDDLVHEGALDDGERLALSALLAGCRDWVISLVDAPVGLILVASSTLVQACAPGERVSVAAGEHSFFLD